MGAWIETHNQERQRVHGTVAPYVGAWIETCWRSINFFWLRSHPMWVRGLKLGLGYSLSYDDESHPMWVRGLKLFITDVSKWVYLSHPMWVRGLKLPLTGKMGFGFVAPYVGAWIETSCRYTFG